MIQKETWQRRVASGKVMDFPTLVIIVVMTRILGATSKLLIAFTIKTHSTCLHLTRYAIQFLLYT